MCISEARDIEVGKASVWDAFERQKSVADADKKRSISIILDASASEHTVRTMLEFEAKQLTEIGNNFLIHHYEKRQVPVIHTDHVDYLFHRLFAFIQLPVGRGRCASGCACNHPFPHLWW